MPATGCDADTVLPNSGLGNAVIPVKRNVAILANEELGFVRQLVRMAGKMLQRKFPRSSVENREDSTVPQVECLAILSR